MTTTALTPMFGKAVHWHCQKGPTHMTDLNMAKFPRRVRETVATLVNHHDVRYRQLDGNHVRLYCGDRNVHPFKLASERPEQHTMRYLDRWIAKNVPEFRASTPTQPEETPVKHAVPKPLPPTEDRTQHVTLVPSRDPVPDAPRTYVRFDDRVSDYLYQVLPDTLIRCNACDYTSRNRQGIHLHEAGHTGKAAEVGRIGGKAAQARDGLSANEQAVRTLMKHFHIKGDTEKLEAENAALRQQVADLKAKLALIKEAMHA